MATSELRGQRSVAHASVQLTGIGRWRLLGAVGSGERAMVYRALDPAGHGAETHEQALKVLHGVLAHDSQVVEAFIERMKTHLRLTRLDHPNIVPCRDVEIAGGRPYAVLELVDAVSLERLFPERGRPKFSLEAATNILIGVLDALAAAANDKIVHGRLSPNDVLVHADGSVVVTGFGQAGDGRMDFLAVHRLAQTMNAPWPPEVDAWLDVLSSETSVWKDVRAARASFPLAYSEAGQKALDRSVRSRRRKDQKALEAAEPVPSDAAVSNATPARDPAPKEAKPARPMAARRQEAEAALRQARFVALSVLGIVLIALAMEVFSSA